MRRFRDIIRICRTDPGVAVGITQCRSDCSPTDLADMWLYVRRRGTRDWVVKYPAWELDDAGNVVFRIDDQFPMDHGRYEGEVRVGDEVLGSVEIYVARSHAATGRGRALRMVPDWRPPKPDGVTDMYEPIYDFRAYLCDVLEKDGALLPLGADDADRLCGVTLCRPAQLVLYDGYHKEVIEFSCTANGIEITRGLAGTDPQRFPRGTEVRFEWTEANVTNAMNGC